MDSDFKKLVEEAANETYNPRARRCWPWSHEWTMWETVRGGRQQVRRCVGCGKEQFTLARACLHQWVTYNTAQMLPAVNGEVVSDVPLGVRHLQRCKHCGDARKVDLW